MVVLARGSCNMAYEEVKAECLKHGRLFEDRVFPCVGRSIFQSKPVAPHVQWKRPSEICRNPKFMVDDASRFDLNQGALGNCWLVAVAAALATRPGLLERVVPPEQKFEKDYAGVFHFNFWRGEWQEVVVDDRLPCKYGKFLLFSKNQQHAEEFWCALLEKAYAKLHDSYEALIGRTMEEILADLTGGAIEAITLTEKSCVPNELFRYMMRVSKMNSLMTCRIQMKTRDGEVRLLRLHNPQGEREWNGAWSDRSQEWEEMGNRVRQKNGMVCEDDGEFWMSFEDWDDNFSELQICHLTSEAPVVEKRQWEMSDCRGSWVKGVSAGGCGDPPHQDMYWTNPQLHVVVTQSENTGTVTHDEEHRCTLIVSVMLEDILRNKHQPPSIGFDIFKVKNEACSPVLLDSQNYTANAQLLGRTMDRCSAVREVCHHYCVKPGRYCIIPLTSQPSKDASFYLRVFSEERARLTEVDETTGPLEFLQPRPVSNHVESSEAFGDECDQMGRKHSCGDDGIDSLELRRLLNAVLAKDGIDVGAEEARTLFKLGDTRSRGVLCYDQVYSMVIQIRQWQVQFRCFDDDVSGTIHIRQLKKAFSRIGIHLGREVWKSLRLRYSNKSNKISFQDFVMCAAKVTILSDTFKSSMQADSSIVSMSQEQFISEALKH